MAKKTRKTTARRRQTPTSLQAAPTSPRNRRIEIPARYLRSATPGAPVTALTPPVAQPSPSLTEAITGAEQSSESLLNVVRGLRTRLETAGLLESIGQTSGIEKAQGAVPVAHLLSTRVRDLTQRIDVEVSEVLADIHARLIV